MTTQEREIAKRSVIRVGAGRGFVMKNSNEDMTDRLVVTAAHCLPRLPFEIESGEDICTYDNLLGSLDDEPTVLAVCLFVDPVGDLAVCGPPDAQVQFEKRERYNMLTTNMATGLPLARIPVLNLLAGESLEPTRAWVLSLDGDWLECSVRNTGRLLYISKGAEHIRPGMSGSPIITDEGSGIGVVSLSSTLSWGMSPSIVNGLPGWLLNEIQQK